MKIKQLVNRILPSKKWKIMAIIISGITVGSLALLLHMMKMHTYLGDEPSACVNCHIMAPYYATWFHGSHARSTTCNDCHVPQDNLIKKWAFKGTDGLKHAAAFISFSEPQVIRAHDGSSNVIMNNCIRCHEQLNTEFVSAGRINYMMAKAGEGKACWDCHRETGHGMGNSLSSTPNALVPYPDSPVPAWLQKVTKLKKSN
ncbi:MAG: cytochrome c nitrite reductase small subunit [Bacteroidales bacterium]|nr:cytochrome c nitrite reductase small subunit [Bacteroidales bacterium]MCL2738291.1 cytochrome c nitrite reductase small subunit [Bacteroidales bacterium]